MHCREPVGTTVTKSSVSASFGTSANPQVVPRPTWQTSNQSIRLLSQKPFAVFCFVCYICRCRFWCRRRRRSRHRRLGVVVIVVEAFINCIYKQCLAYLLTDSFILSPSWSIPAISAFKICSRAINGQPSFGNDYNQLRIKLTEARISLFGLFCI